MNKKKVKKAVKAEVEEKEFKSTDIVDTPKLAPFTGLTISRKPVPYTPELLLDRAGADPKNRPVFMLKPFSTSQRHRVDSDHASVRSEISLWAKAKGIDITNFVDIKGIKDNKSDYSAYLGAIDKLTDTDLQSELVRECLVDVKLKGANKEYKSLKFDADEEGLIKEEVFETYHPELIEDLYNFLYRASNPKWSATLGK